MMGIPFSGINCGELRIASTTLCQPRFESLQLACASAQAGGCQRKRRGPLFLAESIRLISYYVKVHRDEITFSAVTSTDVCRLRHLSQQPAVAGNRLA